MTKLNRQSRARRTVAAGLGIVLIAGATLVASAPALASGSVEVFANEIAPNEDTYTGWHQGYANGVATVTTEGLELSGESQIINGLDAPQGIDGLEDAANGLASWTTTASSAPAYFQIPLFFGPNKSFTTLRPAAPVAGVNTTSVTQDWVSSRALGSYAANEAAPLGDLVAELRAQTNVEVLGFGVLSNAGTTSVVTGISWLGTDYTFHQDPLAAGTATVTGNAIVGSTLSVTTAGWPTGTTLSYQWFWDRGNGDEAIPGATGTSYTITNDVLTRSVGVVVTGTLAGNAPTSVRSNLTSTVVAPTLPATPAGTATITGTAFATGTLNVTTAGWAPGTTLSYEWYWNGGQMGGGIDGATGTSYTITYDLTNRFIGVIVTGTLAGHAPTSVHSNLTAAVFAPQLPTAGPPAFSSVELADFLRNLGVAPQPQTSVGLGGSPLIPSSSATAVVAGWSADSFVDVYGYSTPVLVGTFPVVDGVVRIPLTPSVLSQLGAGAHTLVITGQSSGAVQAVSLTVGAATSVAALASTGANLAAPFTIAALLLLLGAALVVVRRRRLHV